MRERQECRTGLAVVSLILSSLDGPLVFRQERVSELRLVGWVESLSSVRTFGSRPAG